MPTKPSSFEQSVQNSEYRIVPNEVSSEISGDVKYSPKTSRRTKPVRSAQPTLSLQSVQKRQRDYEETKHAGFISAALAAGLVLLMFIIIATLQYAEMIPLSAADLTLVQVSLSLFIYHSMDRTLFSSLSEPIRRWKANRHTPKQMREPDTRPKLRSAHILLLFWMVASALMPVLVIYGVPSGLWLWIPSYLEPLCLSIAIILCSFTFNILLTKCRRDPTADRRFVHPQSITEGDEISDDAHQSFKKPAKVKGKVKVSLFFSLVITAIGIIALLNLPEYIRQTFNTTPYFMLLTVISVSVFLIVDGRTYHTLREGVRSYKLMQSIQDPEIAMRDRTAAPTVRLGIVLSVITLAFFLLFALSSILSLIPQDISGLALIGAILGCFLAPTQRWVCIQSRRAKMFGKLISRWLRRNFRTIKYRGKKYSHWTPEQRLRVLGVVVLIFCNITPLAIECIGQPMLDAYMRSNEFGLHKLASSNAGVDPINGPSFLFLQETETVDLVSLDNEWITDYYYNDQLMWAKPFTGNGSSYLITEMEGFSNFTIYLMYPDYVRQGIMIGEGQTLVPIYLDDNPSPYNIEVPDIFKDYLSLLVIQPLYLNYWENITLEFSEDTNLDNKITDDDTNKDIFTRTFYGYGEITLYVFSDTISYNSLFIEIDGKVIQNLHPVSDLNSQDYLGMNIVADHISGGDCVRYDIQLMNIFANTLAGEHILKIAICGEYSSTPIFEENEMFEFAIISQAQHDFDGDGLANNEEVNNYYHLGFQPNFPDSYGYYTILPEPNSRTLFETDWSYANINIQYNDLISSFLYIDICSNQSSFQNFSVNGLPILRGELEGFNLQFKNDGWYSIFTDMVMIPNQEYNLQYFYATNSSYVKESLVLIANNEIIPLIDYSDVKILSDELKDSDYDGLIDTDDRSPMGSWTVDPEKVLRLITEVQQDSDSEIHFQIAPPENDLYALTHDSNGLYYEWNDESLVTISPVLKLFTDDYSDYSFQQINYEYLGKQLHFGEGDKPYSTLREMSLPEFIDYWDESDWVNELDTDGDGMPDDWENQYGFNPLYPWDAQTETEFWEPLSLWAIHEYEAGTDPTDSDTDNDGISDIEELWNMQNPLNAINFIDSDFDGMSNAFETEFGITSATVDVDNDGLCNLEEFRVSWEYGVWSNPTVGDTDNDGLNDGIEMKLGFNPCSIDSNADGRSDLQEYLEFFEILDATMDPDTFSLVDLMEFGDSAPTSYDQDGVPDSSPYDSIYSIEDWFQQYVDDAILKGGPYESNCYDQDVIYSYYEQFAASRGANNFDGHIYDLSANDKSYEGSIFIPASHISKNDGILDLKMQLLWKVMDLNIFDEIIAEYMGDIEPVQENGEIKQVCDIYEFDFDLKSITIRTRSWDYNDQLSTTYDTFSLENSSIWFPTTGEIDEMLSDNTYVCDYADWYAATNGWGTVDESLIGTRFGLYNDMKELSIGTVLFPGTKIYSHGQPQLMQFYPWETEQMVTFQSIELLEHEEIDYVLYATQTNVEHQLMSTIVKNPDFWNSQSSIYNPDIFNPEEGGIDITRIYGSNSLKSTTSLQLMDRVTSDYKNEVGFGMGWGQKTFDFESVNMDANFDFWIDGNFKMDGGGQDVWVDPWDSRLNTINIGGHVSEYTGPVFYDFGHDYESSSIIFDVALLSGEFRANLIDSTDALCFAIYADLDISPNWWIEQGQTDYDTGIQISSSAFQTVTIVFNTVDNQVNVWINGTQMQHIGLNHLPFINNPSFVSSVNLQCSEAHVYLDKVTVPDWVQLGTSPKILYSNMKYSTRDLTKALIYNEYASTYRGDFFRFNDIDYYLHYSPESYLFDLYRVGNRKFEDTFSSLPLDLTTFDFDQTWLDQTLPPYFSFNQEEQPESFLTAVHDGVLHIHDDVSGVTDIINEFPAFVNGSIESKIKFSSNLPNGPVVAIRPMEFSMSDEGELMIEPVQSLNVDDIIELGVVETGYGRIFAFRVSGSQYPPDWDYISAGYVQLDTWYNFKIEFENISSSEWKIIVTIGEVSEEFSYELPSEYDYIKGIGFSAASFIVDNCQTSIDDLSISTMRAVYSEFPYLGINGAYDLTESGTALTITEYMNSIDYPISPSIMVHDTALKREIPSSCSASGVLEFNLGVTDELGDIDVKLDLFARLTNINGYWHLSHPSGDILINLTIPVFANEMHNWRFVYNDNPLFGGSSGKTAIFYDNSFEGEFQIGFTYTEEIIFDVGEDQYAFINMLSLNKADFILCNDLTTDFEFEGYWHDELPNEFILDGMEFENSVYWTGQFAFPNGTIFAYIDENHLGHIIDENMGNFDWTTEEWQDTHTIPIALYQDQDEIWHEGIKVFENMYAHSASVNFNEYFSSFTVGPVGLRLLDLNSTHLTVNDYTELTDWIHETSIGAFDANEIYQDIYSSVISLNGLTIKIPKHGVAETFDIISDITPTSYKLNSIPISESICTSEFGLLPEGSVITFMIEPDFIANQFLRSISVIMESMPFYSKFSARFDTKFICAFESNKLDSNASNIMAFLSNSDSAYSEVLYTVGYERDYNAQNDAIMPIKYLYLSSFPTSVSISSQLVLNSTNGSLPPERTHVIRSKIVTEYAIPTSLYAHIAPDINNRIELDSILRSSQDRSKFINYLTVNIYSYFGVESGYIWQWASSDSIQTSFDTFWQINPMGDVLFIPGSGEIKDFLRLLCNQLILERYLTSAQVTASFMKELENLWDIMMQYGTLSRYHYSALKDAHSFRDARFWNNAIRRFFPSYEGLQPGFGWNGHKLMNCMEIEGLIDGNYYWRAYPHPVDLFYRGNREDLDKFTKKWRAFNADLSSAMNIADSDISYELGSCSYRGFHPSYNMDPTIMETIYHHIIRPDTIENYLWQRVVSIDPSFDIFNDGTTKYCRFARVLNTILDYSGHIIELEKEMSIGLHRIFNVNYPFTLAGSLSDSDIHSIKNRIVNLVNSEGISSDTANNIRKLVALSYINNRDRVSDIFSSNPRMDWQGKTLSEVEWQGINLRHLSDLDIINLQRFVSAHKVIFDMFANNEINLDEVIYIPIPGGIRKFKLRDWFGIDNDGVPFLRIPVSEWDKPIRQYSIHDVFIHLSQDSTNPNIYHAKPNSIDALSQVKLIKGYLNNYIDNLEGLKELFDDVIESGSLFPDIIGRKGRLFFSLKRHRWTPNYSRSPALTTLYYEYQLICDHLSILQKVRYKLGLDNVDFEILPPKDKAIDSKNRLFGKRVMYDGPGGKHSWGNSKAARKARAINIDFSEGMSNGLDPFDYAMEHLRKTGTFKTWSASAAIDSIYACSVPLGGGEVLAAAGGAMGPTMPFGYHRMDSLSSGAGSLAYSYMLQSPPSMVDEVDNVIRAINTAESHGLARGLLHTDMPNLQSIRYLAQYQEICIAAQELYVRDMKYVDQLVEHGRIVEADALRASLTDLRNRLLPFRMDVVDAKILVDAKIAAAKASFWKDFAIGILVEVIGFCFQSWQISQIVKSAQLDQDEMDQMYQEIVRDLIIEVGLEFMQALGSFAAKSKICAVLGPVGGILEILLTIQQIYRFLEYRRITPISCQIVNYRFDSVSHSLQRRGGYRQYDSMDISERYYNYDLPLLRDHFLRLSARTDDMQENQTNILPPSDIDPWENTPNGAEWHSNSTRVVCLIKWWEDISVHIPLNQITRNAEITVHHYFGAFDEPSLQQQFSSSFSLGAVTERKLSSFLENMELQYIPSEDYDNDGLINSEEIDAKTSLRNEDTDRDKITDYDEVKTYHTNPLSVDSDGDGLNDYNETIIEFTDPNDIDTDGDGLSDYREVLFGTSGNADDSDTDDDGLLDVFEYWQGSFGDIIDSDSDGFSDLTELRFGFNATNDEGIYLSTVLEAVPDGFYKGTHNFNSMAVTSDPWYSNGGGAFGDAYISSEVEINEDVHNFVYLFNQSARRIVATEAYMQDSWSVESYIGIEEELDLGSDESIMLELRISDGQFFTMRYCEEDSEFQYRFGFFNDWETLANVDSSDVACWSVWSIAWNAASDQITFSVDLDADETVDYYYNLGDTECPYLDSAFGGGQRVNYIVIETFDTMNAPEQTENIFAIDSLSIDAGYFCEYAVGDLYDTIEVPDFFATLNNDTMSVTVEWAPLDDMKFGVFYTNVSDVIDIYSQNTFYQGPATSVMEISLPRDGTWWFKPCAIFSGIDEFDEPYSYFFPMDGVFSLEVDTYSATYDLRDDTLGLAPEIFTVIGPENEFGDLTTTVEETFDVTGWYSNRPFSGIYRYILLNDTFTTSQCSIEKQVNLLIDDGDFYEFWWKTNDSNLESKFYFTKPVDENEVESFAFRMEKGYFWMDECNTSIIAWNNTWYHIRLTLSLSEWMELFINGEFIDNYHIDQGVGIKRFGFTTDSEMEEYELWVKGIGVSKYGYSRCENWPEMKGIAMQEETIGFGVSTVPAYSDISTKCLASGSNANYEDFIFLSDSLILLNNGGVYDISDTEPTLTSTIRCWSSAKVRFGKLYIMSEEIGYLGLTVYDLTVPSEPYLIVTPIQGYYYGSVFEIVQNPSTNQIWVIMAINMGNDAYGVSHDWMEPFDITNVQVLSQAPTTTYMYGPYYYSTQDMYIRYNNGHIYVGILDLDYSEDYCYWNDYLGFHETELLWLAWGAHNPYPDLYWEPDDATLFSIDVREGIDFEAKMTLDAPYAIITTRKLAESPLSVQDAYVIDFYRAPFAFEIGHNRLPYYIASDIGNHKVFAITSNGLVCYDATHPMTIDPNPVEQVIKLDVIVSGAVKVRNGNIYSLEIIDTGNEACQYAAYFCEQEHGYLDEIVEMQSDGWIIDEKSGRSDVLHLGSVDYVVKDLIMSADQWFSFLSYTSKYTQATLKLFNSYGETSQSILLNIADNKILFDDTSEANKDQSINLPAEQWNKIRVSSYTSLTTGEGFVSISCDGNAITLPLMEFGLLYKFEIINSIDHLDLDQYQQRVFDTDIDADGSTDLEEILNWGTDPFSSDSDYDGMPDGWEILYGLKPMDDDAEEDFELNGEGDGLSNLEEYLYGTNPNDWDTDRDGGSDGNEIELGTNPLLADDADSDEDGTEDVIEEFFHLMPYDSDMDDDGLEDTDEIDLETDPTVKDTDSDGMWDGYEVACSLDPHVDDADGDLDSDKVSNINEYTGGAPLWSQTNANSKLDIDSDGMPDDWERFYNVYMPDDDSADQDKVTNLQEYIVNTNPTSYNDDQQLEMSRDWCTYWSIEYSTAGANADYDGDKIKNSLEYKGKYYGGWAYSTNPQQQESGTPPTGGDVMQWNMRRDWCTYWEIPFTNQGKLDDYDGDKLLNWNEFYGKYTFDANTILNPRDSGFTLEQFTYEWLNSTPITLYVSPDWRIYQNFQLSDLSGQGDADNDKVLNWQEFYGKWTYKNWDDALYVPNPHNAYFGYGMSADWCIYWDIPFSQEGADGDADADGVYNDDEYAAGTNPRNKDTDGDRLPDKYEIKWGLNPLSTANENGGDEDDDFDDDDVPNYYEYRFDPVQMRMDPTEPNTDGDSRTDYVEWVLYFQYNNGAGLKHSDGYQVNPLEANSNPISVLCKAPTGYTNTHGIEVHGTGVYKDVGMSLDSTHGWCRSDALWVQANIETTWTGYASYYGYNNATVRALLASVKLYYKAEVYVTNINMPAYNFQWEYKRNTDSSFNVAYVPGCDGALSSGEKNYWFYNPNGNALDVQYFRTNAAYVTSIGYKVSVTWYWGAWGGVENDYSAVMYNF